MGLIVFIAIGSLSCAFLLFVLLPWMRVSQRRSFEHRGAGDSTQGQPFVVSSRKHAESPNKTTARKRGATRDRSSLPGSVQRISANPSVLSMKGHVVSRNRS